VLFIPLLLIRNGPVASASPELVASVRHHASPGPVQTRPGGSERSAQSAGHPNSARQAGPTVAATVAADTTAAGTVPTTVPAPATTGTERAAPSSSQIAAAVHPSSQTSSAAAPTLVPVTTTTLPPVSETGKRVVTHGIVTFYNHPAGRCASPWIPFGTTVWITNPANGESVSCVVDDYEADTSRSIDLATATFAEIAPLSQGVIDAELSW
jgi:hypothetical protein